MRCTHEEDQYLSNLILFFCYKQYFLRNEYKICIYYVPLIIFIGRDISLRLLISHHEHFLPLYFLQRLHWPIPRAPSQFCFLESTHLITRAVNLFLGSWTSARSTGPCCIRRVQEDPASVTWLVLSAWVCTMLGCTSADRHHTVL